jgi:hypothetical protein
MNLPLRATTMQSIAQTFTPIEPLAAFHASQPPHNVTIGTILFRCYLAENDNRELRDKSGAAKFNSHLTLSPLDNAASDHELSLFFDFRVLALFHQCRKWYRLKF